MQNNVLKYAGRVALVGAAALLMTLPGLSQQPAAPAPPAPPAPPSAHVRPGGPMRAEMHREMRELNLTPEQHKQIQAIHQEMRPKIEALRSDTSLTPRDRHQQMKQLHQEAMAKVRDVLTDEQKAKFDALQTERQARMRERMRERGRAPESAPGPNAPAPPSPPPPPPPAN